MPSTVVHFPITAALDPLSLTMFRPRFSIRDLLWLTLVVGMAVGWWVDHDRLWAKYAEQFHRARKAENELLMKSGILR